VDAREALFGFFLLPAFAFTVGYYPALHRLALALVSPYPKADLHRRLYAAAIDSLVVATSVVFAATLSSIWFLALGALYALMRDSVQGQSLGKLMLGLVVIRLETGRPATAASSLRRNVVFMLPGANLAAAFLETRTLLRDVQGQRLGDRLAHTQVVDGLGVKDLAHSFIEWWNTVLSELPRGRRSKRGPAIVDP
jgi:uncharacterized RDD family membrane protein YckC